MNGEITGRARLGRRTKDLVKRLGPQDVAIVDHADIDRVSAEELAESGVRAVVNVSRSSTGRFPNPGPLELVRAGVRLVDAPGAPLFDELADGDLVRLDGGSVWRNGTLVAEGTVLDAASLEEALADQQSRVSHALEAFAENTLRHLQEEAGVTRGRHRATDAAHPFPRPARARRRPRAGVQVRPADGAPVRPRLPSRARRGRRRRGCASRGRARRGLIVGDFDSVSDASLRAGAELVVHAYPSGGAPGAARLRGLGLPYHVVSAPGISEDLALQLAYEKGATLIVAVGTHFNLVEFLERDREGMASTFVTRLKVGESLVDAKGVSRLVSRRVGIWPLAVFAATGIIAILGAVLASPALRNVIQSTSRAIANGLGL